jgi:hypothetical protein
LPWREALNLFAKAFAEPSDSIATSDVDAAAALLVELLAGSLPWGPEVPAHERDLDSLRSSLADKAPGLPTGVVAAIAIAFNPESRLSFPTTADFLQALHEGAVGFLPRLLDSGWLPSNLPAGESSEAVSGPPREVIRHSRLTVLVGVPALLALGLTAVWWIAHDGARPLSEPRRETRFLSPAPPPQVPFDTPAPSASPPIPPPRVSVPAVPSEPPPREETTQVETPPPAAREETLIDPLETRRLEVDRSRQEIRAGIERLDEQLAQGDTEGVRERLEELTELAQLYPADLAEERRDIRRAQDRWLAAVRQRQAWEDRLSAIRKLMSEGKYPEAVSMASSLSREPGVPAGLGDQARELEKQARQELKRIFEETRVGTTENNLQKPPD